MKNIYTLWEINNFVLKLGSGGDYPPGAKGAVVLADICLREDGGKEERRRTPRRRMDESEKESLSEPR